MAQHFIAAIDEDGMTDILAGIASGISGSTSGSSGAFGYSLAWEIFPGDFDLIDADDIIRFREWDIHTDISFSVTIDLDDILPDICTPEICVPYWTPWGGWDEACTPTWCIDWPSKTFSVSLPTLVSEISADFSIDVSFDAGAHQWVIKGLVNPVTLDIDIIDLAGTIEEAFHDSIGAVISGIPGIGPWLDDAIGWILEAVIDSFDDLSEAIFTAISDSLSLQPVFGIGFELHRVDELFTLVAASGAEPAVRIRITDLDAEINADEEFVVSADIAVP